MAAQWLGESRSFEVASAFNADAAHSADESQLLLPSTTLESVLSGSSCCLVCCTAPGAGAAADAAPLAIARDAAARLLDAATLGASAGDLSVRLSCMQVPPPPHCAGIAVHNVSQF